MAAALSLLSGDAADAGNRASATARPDRSDVLAAVAEGSPAALAVCSQAGQLEVLWANPAAADLVGLDGGDRLERDPAASGAVRLDDLRDWISVVTDWIAEGAPSTREWRSAAVDARDPLTSAVQVSVQGIEADTHVVWLRPATPAERIAEDARRESEHRFNALAEDAPIGIAVSEAGTRLGFVNTCFAQIAGVDRGKLLGTQWLKTIHPEDLPGLLEAIEEVLGGAPTETVVRMLSLTHTVRWISVRLSPVTTPRRAAGFIATVEDITARHAWEAQLSYQATHDALTGLANRRSLMESLAELLASRRNRDGEAAVLFCDLDGFKQVNDSLGHDAGDRVLIEVAQRLSATARDHDLVARMAGDEFVVLLTGINGYPDAEAAAIRQLQALQPPLSIAGELVRISTSIGIAMARDFDSAQSLLQAADRGMYEAKHSGLGLYRRGLPPTALSGISDHD